MRESCVALASAANAVTDTASDLVGEKREHCEINQVEGPGRDVAKTTSLAGHDLRSSYDFSSLLAARVLGRDGLSQAVCGQARKYESAMEPSVTGDGLGRWSEPMRPARAGPWPAVVGGQLQARPDLRLRQSPRHLDRGWGALPACGRRKLVGSRRVQSALDCPASDAVCANRVPVSSPPLPGR